MNSNSRSAASRALSADRERHRTALVSTGDEEARRRFTLPDASSPDYEARLKALEAEIDRSIGQLDQLEEDAERAKARKQLKESTEDPAPLSDYKRAEAIKRDAD